MSQGTNEAGLWRVKAWQLVDVDDLPLFGGLFGKSHFENLKGFKPVVWSGAGIACGQQGTGEGEKFF